MTGALVALGDSLSCGEGVGIRLPLEQTWPALLADRLGLVTTTLATPGRRLTDVLQDQLPMARALLPDVATVLVGLNDVLRSDIGHDEATAALRMVVVELQDAGAEVLLVRLHDPTRLLPVPRLLRTALLRRVSRINSAVDGVVRDTGCHALDLTAVPGLEDRAAWAVDRMHPSVRGHSTIADAAAGVLAAAGLAVRGAPRPAADCVAPRRLAEVGWVARHALPYAALHGRQFLPGLVPGPLRGSG